MGWEPHWQQLLCKSLRNLTIKLARLDITKAIEQVASRLGNTTSVCRKCYIHPAIIDAYLDQSLIKTLQRRTERELKQSLNRLKPRRSGRTGTFARTNEK